MPKKRRGARGLCKVCHYSALGAIRRKETTWQELEELGLAEERHTSLIMKAVKKKKESLTKSKKPA